MARPDVMQLPGCVGRNGSDMSPLRKADQRRCIKHLEKTMLDAAIGDLSDAIDFPVPLELSSIQAIDDHFDTTAIAKLIAASDPTEDGNPYFITCIELGAMMAAIMRNLVPELEWIADSPYWESSLWHSETGTIIPPTHWAIKKLSSYGWNDGLVPKIICGVEPLAKKRKSNRTNR